MGVGFLYFSTKGRITRQAWWLGALVLGALVIAFVMAAMFSGAALSPAAFFWLFGATSVAASYPYYCLSVKRLHDGNENGRLLLAYLVLSAIAMIAQTWFITTVLLPSMETRASLTTMLMPSFSTLSNVLGALTAIQSACGLYLLYLLGFQMGTKGANKHGPDPLRPPVPAA